MSQNDLILEIRERYQQSIGVLNERQRRLWAAGEAMRLGRGGIAAISKALRISPNTIKKGMQEIAAASTDAIPEGNHRVRKVGGGRKPRQESSIQPVLE
jgi:hypothetical protein